MSLLRKVTKRWTMRDGTRIRICDMSDAHLQNAIAFIERYAKVCYANDRAVAAVLAGMFDGESMASYYTEQNFDSVNMGGPNPDAVSPLYEPLCDELARRGLP